MEFRIFSLYEVAAMIESFIDEAFGGQYYWITAEIASLNVRRGHCYLNLIEKETGNTFPKAEMKGIIWQNNYIRLNENFSSVTGFPLKQDIGILFLASLNYNPRFGLSLNILDIKGEYTLGEMMLERKKTVQKLISNNLYDRNKQVPLPEVPQRIAALSAQDSKGFEDFLNVLKNNQFGYVFNVRLFPVMLQGNRAAESIAGQLQSIEQHCHEFDFVILVRGGGGNVDLHCFNSYVLAEAIAKSSLPIVTGIGHTTDFTIADEVAAVSKETPTAVAQYIVSLCAGFEKELNEKGQKIGQISFRLMELETMTLEKDSGAIRYIPRHRVQGENIRISNISEQITSKSFSLLRLTFSELVQDVKILKKGISTALKQENERLHILDKVIAANDPSLLLKKGYSLTRFKGKIVKDVKILNKGDEIETVLRNGKIISTIDTLEKT